MGDVACHHHHLRKQDIPQAGHSAAEAAQSEELPVLDFLGAISWARILPDGACAPNQNGAGPRQARDAGANRLMYERYGRDIFPTCWRHRRGRRD